MTREVPSSKSQVPRFKAQGLDASLTPFPEPEARERKAGGAGREAAENHRNPAHVHVPPSPRPEGTREAFASSVRNRRGQIAPFLSPSRAPPWVAVFRLVDPVVLARRASLHHRLISGMPPACVHGRPNIGAGKSAKGLVGVAIHVLFGFLIFIAVIVVDRAPLRDP
jgi:hypothetical protein